MEILILNIKDILYVLDSMDFKIGEKSGAGECNPTLEWNINGKHVIINDNTVIAAKAHL